MNLVSAMVGLSIMGAAAPSMMTMSIAPFEAQKRAINLGIAESAAVGYSASNEGKPDFVGDVPEICERTDLGDRAYEVECTEGDGQYIQTVTRSFRLAVELACDDNDGNNGHGNSGGDDCSNPGQGGYANNVRVFNYPSPPGFTGHQCIDGVDNWGLDTDAFDREKNKWKGKSCTPGELRHSSFYHNSDPDAWMYDINGEEGYGPHIDY
jgi:hypothetical protein